MATSSKTTVRHLHKRAPDSLRQKNGASGAASTAKSSSGSNYRTFNIGNIPTYGENPTPVVDFSNISEIERIANDLIAKVDKVAQPNIETVIEAENWIYGVESTIDSLPPAEQLRALMKFDAVHRIAFRKKASDSFIGKHLLSIFDARIHMDRSIDDHLLFRMITDAVENRRDKAFFDKPLMWQSLTLEKWYRQFRSGTGLEDLSERDIAERVSILLETDLWAFDPRNQSAFKHHLLTTYRPYLTPSSQTHPI